MDLTALPVTPEELDAWLCSTDVDDGGSEAQRQHQEETPTTPMSTLPLLSTPSQSSAQPKNDECHDDVQANSKSQQQCYDHRRSSLDFVSASNLFAGKDYFGIDERTMLMASFAKDVFGHHGENCRLVGESSLSISNATDRSPTSSIDSREPVNRDAILSQMEQTQPMPFMEWRGRPKGSHHGVPCPQQLSRHAMAPPRRALQKHVPRAIRFPFAKTLIDPSPIRFRGMIDVRRRPFNAKALRQAVPLPVNSVEVSACPEITATLLTVVTTLTLLTVLLCFIIAKACPHHCPHPAQTIAVTVVLVTFQQLDRRKIYHPTCYSRQLNNPNNPKTV